MRGREDDLQSAEGVIVKGVGGLYYARGEDGGTHVLRARGIFRRRHITPMVGDRVRFTPGQGEEHGWVEEILPRESQLVRPPVANIDRIVVVVLREVGRAETVRLDMEGLRTFTEAAL